MTEDDLTTANSRQRSKIRRLARSLGKQKFRHSYMARQLKLFLAEQIRALRDDLTQKEFGDRIGKPQSVVSRLEKQADRQISVQTLIDIAEHLDIAIIIRFIDFPTFFKYTEDYSDEALRPASYNQEAINTFAEEQQQLARELELRDLFHNPPSSESQSRAVRVDNNEANPTTTPPPSNLLFITA